MAATPVRPTAKSDRVNGSGTSVGWSVTTVLGGLPSWVPQFSVNGKQLGSTGGRSSSSPGGSSFRKLLGGLPLVSSEGSSVESSDGSPSLSLSKLNGWKPSSMLLLSSSQALSSDLASLS